MATELVYVAGAFGILFFCSYMLGADSGQGLSVTAWDWIVVFLVAVSWPLLVPFAVVALPLRFLFRLGEKRAKARNKDHSK